MHIKIHKAGQVNEEDLKFVVICVKFKTQWLLVRHKERTTWEMPGGHIESGESSQTAAVRELYEETGIITEEIKTICDYEVCNDGSSSYGRLFYVCTEKLGELPGYEIEEVKLFDDFPENSTYHQIYKILISQIRTYEDTRNLETNIYFVRHAQPDISIKDDMLRPLTEKGMADTKRVTKVLKDRNIEAIYSSPYKRAYDTVKDLAEVTRLEINIVEGFRERKVDNVWVDDFKAFSRRQWEDFNFKLECGECLREVQERNVAALNDVLKNNLGSNIVVGSHGTALSTIINYYNPDFGYEGFWSITDKMPYILCFKFKNMEFIGMEEVEL
jgi:2,3-bisphosphoglycerate-dependent phosphoglycerate mutase